MPVFNITIIVIDKWTCYTRGIGVSCNEISENYAGVFSKIIWADVSADDDVENKVLLKDTKPGIILCIRPADEGRR